MAADTHGNGLLIIPDQATAWLHYLNENYTNLMRLVDMEGGDHRYFLNSDYDVSDEQPWFLKFENDSGNLSDTGQTLTKLLKQGTKTMEDASWQRTDSSYPWQQPLLMIDSYLNGDIYYVNTTALDYTAKAVISEHTVYPNLVSGDALTQLVSIPLVTFGSSLTIIGAESTGDAHILMAHIVSSTGAVTPTLQGANIIISPTPLTGSETSTVGDLYVYLGTTELQLSFAGPLSKTFSVCYNTVTDPS